jgi:hypothetical protein
MFNWLKRKSILPAFSSANPGKGTWVRVAFSNGERSWSEKADSLGALAAVLEGRGIGFRRGDGHLELENGLIARPQFVHLQPRDDGSVQTATTLEINHPTLCPGGTFEYQHSLGSTAGDSMNKGFVGWVDVDLPVFMDALRDKFETCSAMLWDAPASGSSAARKRQAILGPPVHCVTKQVDEAGGAHNFCPCCLLTNCFEAFADQMQGDEFYGIRLYAMRNVDGHAEADCRVNGVEWSAGKEALLKYVATWPDRGFEYRKQFVAIRSLEPSGIDDRADGRLGA